MKIKRISVDSLNRLAKSRNIWCIGCGKRLFEMLEIYSDEPFVQNINGLLDNNEKLWGVSKQFKNKKLTIENPILLKEMEYKKIVLLITSDHYEEIYKSIIQYLDHKKNISVYLYPQIYFQWAETILKVSGLLPVKRQILFYAGNEPHDNADEIVRYLKEEYCGKKYSIVYLEDRKCITGADNIIHLDKWTMAKKNRLKDIINYCVVYARSRYICYENEALFKISKKQKLIYLNHGTIPLKNVSDVLKQPADVDFATCPGEGCALLYEQQYNIAREKQIYMMPARVNRMLTSQGRLHSLINADGKKVILWLPTFRQLAGSERRDSVNSDPVSLLSKHKEEINQILQENNQILVIKKHPREKASIVIPSALKCIKVLDDNYLQKKGISLQELLKDTDALITDYSGIVFEYMLLDRPIGYVITDIEQYHRGFAVANTEEYMPGYKINNISELKYFLQSVKGDVDKDIYSSCRNELVNKLFGRHAYDNGAKELIDFMDNLKG